MLDKKWNSEILLVFAHMVLAKTLGACNTREIQSNIDHYLDLWERGIHAGLVDGVLSEVRAREG